MAGRITHHDGTWSNILCEECKLAHKQLTKYIRWQHPCPYCNALIELPSLKTSLKEESAAARVAEVS